MYPHLEKFFTNALKVNTVTAGFMLKQLAAASASVQKNSDDIKGLMLSTSVLLQSERDTSKFDKSLEILSDKKYLPCKSTTGTIEFRSAAQTFFIADNQYYAERFIDQLTMLDFSYDQLNSLHELFRLLKIEDHYLSKHVRQQTSAENSVVNDKLTLQFRQCTYAISWSVFLIFYRNFLISYTAVRYFTEVHSTLIKTEACMISSTMPLYNSRPTSQQN